MLGELQTSSPKRVKQMSDMLQLVDNWPQIQLTSEQIVWQLNDKLEESSDQVRFSTIRGSGWPRFNARI